MPRNGSGTYSLPAGNPVVTGTTISSTVQNNTTSDIATALTNSLAKDGQTTPTANLPMGGFKLTGLAAGSVAGDSVRYEQVLLLTGGTVAGATTFSAATTFSSDITVPNEAYNATTWNGNNEAPTKNAVRDQFEKVTTLLATYTASASAQIDITEGFDGTYSSLEFVFENISPATNAVNFNCRLSTDGGGTFLTTNYFSAAMVNNAATAVGSETGSAAEMPINAATNLSNGANETLSGILNLFSPAIAARPYITSQAMYRTSAGGNSIAMRGHFNTATTVNAIRFYMSSGNIASGKIYVYGRKK
jgi:hypothetical protein